MKSKVFKRKQVVPFIIALMIFMIFLPAFSYAEKTDNDNLVQRYVSYQDVSLFTQVFNYSPRANEAIVYLQGVTGSHADAQFLHHPSNSYMTISFDYLNQGKSESIDDLNWDAHLESIKAVMEFYGIKKAYLVGHSFGADTAIMFADKYSNMVHRVVLIDSAYYNYDDLDQFNFTRPLMELLEYNPVALDYASFSKYLDMSYDNDITKYWDIKKRLLHIEADPNLTFKNPNLPSIPETISVIKQFPEMFGFTPEQVADLPDVSEEDVDNLINFLSTQLDVFADANHRFTAKQAPYSHGMVYEVEAWDYLRENIFSFIKNGK